MSEEVAVKPTRAFIISGVSEAPTAQAYTKRYHYDGNKLLYEGWAVSGSSETAAVWAIKKYITVGSDVVQEQWADGNTEEDNIWSQRTSLTYI